MTDRDRYTPGPASGAEMRKDGGKWTLILVRELRICASGRPFRPMGAWVRLPPSFRTAVEPEEASTCGGCRLR